MSKTLQIQFDPNQDYQVEAVQSVVDLFEGRSEQTVEFNLGDEIVANLPDYDDFPESWLEDNLSAVQRDNSIGGTLLGLDVDDGPVLDGVGNESWRFPHFTIEMETGTGKTYVYLRTIYELRKRFGFTKFIIVVPSIAIFEGVVKNFAITRDHFRALYDNETTNLVPYDSARISQLRSFATSTATEIMVMTVDAFNKTSNVIYKASEKLPGERKPYQFIQETRPILILDEPQNMESDKAREALRTLHPLFALRYSATHKTSPNLIYRLTPFDAFRRNLVKKIQVLGITERDNFNTPFLALQSISRQQPLTATVSTYVTRGGQTRTEQLVLKHGENLYARTGRDEHKDGYRVVDINAAEGFVEFENGIKIYPNETIGPSRPAIFRKQIEETIKRHMEIHERLVPQGIKVLSLFFIDRVANYRDDNGIIKRLFDEEFDRIKRQYLAFKDVDAASVRSAYFAQSKTKSGDIQAIDTSGSTTADRAAEKAAFELIMRDKERLLSADEPVQFIFAHSALKEGWDNPNVFQICTLNQTVSPIKKRQEIGRGLRICVNQDGQRVFGDDINVLTVVANESYRDYADNLQKEYEEDGQAAPPKPTNAHREPARRNEAVFGAIEFKHFWERLSRRVTYDVNIDTPALVDDCITRLNAAHFPQPVLIIDEGRYVSTRYTITARSITAKKARISIERLDTDDSRQLVERDLDVGADLSKIFDDSRLRKFKIIALVLDSGDPRVRFSDTEIRLNKPYIWDTAAGQRVLNRQTTPATDTYGVFNLVDRAARETNLTRPTINKIFKGMREEQQAKIFTNPEGFVGLFISTIREALARHIAERITFKVDGNNIHRDLESLFPEELTFPQKEMVTANDHGLYDHMQIDSGEEETFVNRLKRDPEVLFYFKFPPTFKVPLPKLIGNYNPDWGIGRYDDNGSIVLHLIRETKGAEDPTQLRFPSEARKITCATKYFAALTMDYRHIKGNTPNWWKPAQDAGIQELFDATKLD